jgi:SAM-dependent methyltransferase
VTLERIGASYLLKEHSPLLSGLVLELGVGRDPYSSAAPNRISVDISPTAQPDVIADAHHLPFRDGTFDSVIASQVFEHLHSPWVAAAELDRVVNGSGTVIVTVPFLYGLHEEPHDYFRFTEWGLKRILGEHFSDVTIIAYGGRLASAADQLLRATPSSSFVRRSARRLRKAVFGEGTSSTWPVIARWLLRRPGEFPCGYIAICR